SPRARSASPSPAARGASPSSRKPASSTEGPAMLRQRGATLVELVVFIVLVSIALVSLVTAMSQFTRYSTDPLIRKQALAIAESLLDEIMLMPFTFCDPDDAHAS